MVFGLAVTVHTYSENQNELSSTYLVFVVRVYYEMSSSCAKCFVSARHVSVKRVVIASRSGSEDARGELTEAGRWTSSPLRFTTVREHSAYILLITY